MPKITIFDQKSWFFQSGYTCSYGRYMAGNMHLGCLRLILSAFTISGVLLVHFSKIRKKSIFWLFFGHEKIFKKWQKNRFFSKIFKSSYNIIICFRRCLGVPKNVFLTSDHIYLPIHSTYVSYGIDPKNHPKWHLQKRPSIIFT